MRGAGTRNPVSVPQNTQGRERWFEGAQGRAMGALSYCGKGKALRDAGHRERILWRRRKDGWRGWGVRERGRGFGGWKGCRARAGTRMLHP